MNEYSRELMHWGVELGAERDGHKYIARVEGKKPGSYIYFYDLDKYNAWKNGAKNKLKDVANRVRSSASNAIGTASRAVKTSASKARTAVNAASKRIAEEAVSTKRSVRAVADKYANYVGNKASSGVAKVKSISKEALDAGKKAAMDASSYARDTASSNFAKVKSISKDAISEGKKLALSTAGNVASAVKSVSSSTLKKVSDFISSKSKMVFNGENGNGESKSFISNLGHLYVSALGSAAYRLIKGKTKDTTPAITANTKHGHREYLAKLEYPNGHVKYIKDEENWKRFAEVTKYQNNEQDFMHSLPEIEVNDDGSLPTKEQDMGEVNEKVHTDQTVPGGKSSYRTVNCTYCSTAYELRRRGYDVEAANLPSNVSATNVSELYQVKDSSMRTKSHVVYSDTPITSDASRYGKLTPIGASRSDAGSKKYAYRAESYELDNHDENIKSITPSTTISNAYASKDDKGNIDPKWKASMEKEIKSAMSDFPEGSRGMFNVYWKAGGGHSLVWEKDKNGKIEIIDSQVGKKIPLEDVMADVDPAAPVQMVRTDSLKFNRKVLGRVTAN